MKRDVLEKATVQAAGGYSLTITGLSEDKDAGVPSVANRGAVDLILQGPEGVALTLHLGGADAASLVPALVSGAVLTETEADIARRYLRDHAQNMYPHQIASLQKTAGLPYDQQVLDAAMKAVAK